MFFWLQQWITYFFDPLDQSPGNSQRDRRKFLGHFHSGSQISLKSIKHSLRFISSQCRHSLQQNGAWFQSEKDESSVNHRVLCRHEHWRSEHVVTRQTRSRSNVNGACTRTEMHKFENSLSGCKCWPYSLDMTLWGWLWSYLWPKTAFEMSQKFLTASQTVEREPSMVPLKPVVRCTSPPHPPK